MTRRIALSISLVAFASACPSREPISIGFAASLSGKDYQLGVEGRNAAELFVKEANASGGIAGRELRLRIRDFESDDAMVAPLTGELVASGLQVIVGYYTSSAALAALGAAGLYPGKVALVSPSATSAGLDGKSDALYRTVMSSRNDAAYLAAHMRAAGLGRPLLVGTAGNEPYYATYAEPLRKLLPPVAELRFQSVRDLDYALIAGLAATGAYDAVVIVASPLDTGAVAQELTLRGLSRPLYLSGWAGNDDLLTYGGTAVEGAVFVHQTDPGHEGASGLARRYEAAFGVAPGFGAIQTWDAFLLVRAAIEASGGRPANLAAALASLRSFEGLCGAVAIDEYGDATRPVYLKRVVKGGIVVEGSAP